VLSPSQLAARLNLLKHGFFAGEMANPKNVFDGTKLAVVVWPPLHHKASGRRPKVVDPSRSAVRNKVGRSSIMHGSKFQ
jgi:hypothetical protein